MLSDGSKPQNSLLEAVHRLISYKTDVHSLLHIQHLVCLSRVFKPSTCFHMAVHTCGMVIQAARKPFIKNRHIYQKPTSHGILIALDQAHVCVSLYIYK